ncbi:Glutamyl-tRNA amidotransferase subunit A, mitochondrial [Crucibulum laeve]|uniref:Glutamyl-tRNA(Gln) amidotransferase subunit A, mitochondrial n=1 Tax=Crucibulum laeve TaxID=68775 RepID=A0A5C3M3A0_9AGAR|nr:Glutamyl-tRNA amidotransferase subunit A, mitochondrial [Crucibulum laeve]
MRADVVRKCTDVCRTHFVSRKISTEACKWYQAIAEKNAVVNAFVHVTNVPKPSKAALPLSGLSIAIKDNIATKSSPTTCSSAMLKDFVSPFDATVVKLLQDSGADIIGKTNCDEFGMGSLNVHSVHGPVINPFTPSTVTFEQRSAGGSSGGSAAAVAAGMCSAALGTDTGGSIRLPASYCGVAGLKPSYGLISRWGVVSFADSLDCVGILAKTIPEIRRIFDTISVYDMKDTTAATPEVREQASRELQKRLKTWPTSESGLLSLEGLRVGIPQEYFPLELSSAVITPVRQVISALKDRGAKIIPVSLPSTSYALSAYYVLASAEASSNMARYDGVQYGMHIRPPPSSDLTKTSKIYAAARSVAFGQEVQKRILLGTYALSADAFDNYFLQAQRVRQLVKDDFNRIFRMQNFSGPSEANQDGADVLIHPSAIRTAPPLTSANRDNSGLDAYVQDVLTVPASLAGLPALSVPSRASSEQNGVDDDGWPIGVSVVGQWGSDEMVMRVGEAIETLLATK